MPSTEDAMPVTPQLDHVPEGEPLPVNGSTPLLLTPVIQTQDLEHVATPETRVSNKGVKVTPRMDSDEERDFRKEDEEALQALEQIERELRAKQADRS
jgi:hypothetical protein